VLVISLFLESTFQLDLEEDIQIMVNPSSKRLVSMNLFNFQQIHCGFDDC